MLVPRVILLLIALVVGVESRCQDSSDLGFFQGQVIDASTGGPIAFAKVEVHRSGHTWEGQCDFDGSFLVRCPSNWLSVIVRWEGYVSEWFVVDLTDGFEQVTVRLSPLPGK